MLYQLSYSRSGAQRLVVAQRGVKRYCTESV
jgi:hypothetical protein